MNREVEGTLAFIFICFVAVMAIFLVVKVGNKIFDTEPQTMEERLIDECEYGRSRDFGDCILKVKEYLKK